MVQLPVAIYCIKQPRKARIIGLCCLCSSQSCTQKYTHLAYCQYEHVLFKKWHCESFHYILTRTNANAEVSFCIYCNWPISEEVYKKMTSLQPLELTHGLDKQCTDEFTVLIISFRPYLIQYNKARCVLVIEN